jgi:hypothetical protein
VEFAEVFSVIENLPKFKDYIIYHLGTSYDGLKSIGLRGSMTKRLRAWTLR